MQLFNNRKSEQGGEPVIQPEMAFKLPERKYLRMLFAANQDNLPTDDDCYLLLWVAAIGNMYCACPRCGLISHFNLQNTKNKARPVYGCEYGFCAYTSTIVIPFMTSASRISIAQWLMAALLLMEYPQINNNELAQRVGTSWITAGDMREKLQSVMHL